MPLLRGNAATRKMHCHNKEQKEKVMFGSISVDFRSASSFNCSCDCSLDPHSSDAKMRKEEVNER